MTRTLREVSEESGSVVFTEPRYRRAHACRPTWAQWNGHWRHNTIGVEEELMLLDPVHCSLVQSGEGVLGQLSDELSPHTRPETHAAIIELVTGIHSDVAGAVAELAALRAQLAVELRAMGLSAASAGTYPLECAGENRVSAATRYLKVAESMRGLARREPTLALHVHIGVPDPEDAVMLLNRLRGAVPVLLALSANSPFSQGRDTGFASARTVIFQGFPRTGTPRRFADYAEYVQAVDALIATGAIPDPSFLWWDVRLQPGLGTVEVRVMDAQTSVADSAALIALIHALARFELEGDSTELEVSPEVSMENRFLAARDGMNARLIDPVRRQMVPARSLLDVVLARCRAYGDPVGSVELDRVARLAEATGAERQRRCVRKDGLVELVPTLTQRFARIGGPGRAARVAPARKGAFG
jgi:carboxylate-amine ligase